MSHRPQILHLGTWKFTTKEAAEKWREGYFLDGWDCEDVIQLEDGKWSFAAIKK